jgi:hypothetical protein
MILAKLMVLLLMVPHVMTLTLHNDLLLLMLYNMLLFEPSIAHHNWIKFIRRIPIAVVMYVTHYR